MFDEFQGIKQITATLQPITKIYLGIYTCLTRYYKFKIFKVKEKVLKFLVKFKHFLSV